MNRLFLLASIVVLSVLLAACAGAGAPATDAAKPVHITITSEPAPAMMGETELILTITDAQGAPIEGATVDVSADHTDMSGMGMSGVATDQGGGKYSIQANFTMSGNWKLIVYVRKDGLDYQEEFEFQVQ